MVVLSSSDSGSNIVSRSSSMDDLGKYDKITEDSQASEKQVVDILLKNVESDTFKMILIRHDEDKISERNLIRVSGEHRRDLVSILDG